MTKSVTSNITNNSPTANHQSQDDGLFFWERQKILGKIPTTISFSKKDIKANALLNMRVKEVFEGVREGNISKIHSAFSKGSIPPAIHSAAILDEIEKNNLQTVEVLLSKEGKIPEKTLYIALEFGLNNKDPSIIKICLVKLNLSRKKMVFILESIINHNHTDALETLLDRIDIESDIYAQLLRLALQNKNAKAVDILLKQKFSSSENPDEAANTLKAVLEKFDNILITPTKSQVIHSVIGFAISTENYEIIPALLNQSITRDQLMDFLTYAGKQSDLTILKTSLETALETALIEPEALGKLVVKALHNNRVDAAEVFLEKCLLLGNHRNEAAVLATEKGSTSILSFAHKEGSLSFESYSKAMRIAIDKRNFEHVMILLYNNPSHAKRNLLELIQHTTATIQEIGLTTEMQTILILLLQEYWLG